MCRLVHADQLASFYHSSVTSLNFQNGISFRIVLLCFIGYAVQYFINLGEGFLKFRKFDFDLVESLFVILGHPIDRYVF